MRRMWIPCALVAAIAAAWLALRGSDPEWIDVPAPSVVDVRWSPKP